MLKKIKVLIIALIVAIIIFASICVLWFVRYNILIKPMLQNENLIFEDNYNLWNNYGYNGDMIRFSVAAPKFLKFTGNLSVITAVNYDKNWQPTTEYTYSLMYQPYLFRENNYRFTVYDYTNIKEQGTSPVSYYFFTDRDLNLISESEPGIYDKFIDQIKPFYDDVKEFYGEDVFK